MKFCLDSMCQWSSRVWAAQQLMSEESVNTNNLTSYKPNLMWGALQAVVSNRTIYRREGKKTSGSCAGVCTHARWHEAGEVKGCPGESSRLHFTMQLSWFWLKTPELNKKNPALTRRFAGMERSGPSEPGQLQGNEHLGPGTGGNEVSSTHLTNRK